MTKPIIWPPEATSGFTAAERALFAKAAGPAVWPPDTTGVFTAAERRAFAPVGKRAKPGKPRR